MLSGTAAKGCDGEKACAGAWPTSRLAAGAQNMEMTGSLDVTAGSTRDASTMASGANSGPFHRASENEADFHTDYVSLLSQPTDHAAATESNLDAGSEAEAAIPGYDLWMKLVQGS